MVTETKLGRGTGAQFVSARVNTVPPSGIRKFFDIVATMPPGVSRDQIPEMLQSLLAERFSLAVHRENKEQPVYALVVSKTGPRLKAASATVEAMGSEAAGAQILYTPFGEAHMDTKGGWQIGDGPYGPIRMSVGPNATTQVEFLQVTMGGWPRR